MILRIALFALMALGLAGFGTVAWLSMQPPPPPPMADAPPPPPPPARLSVLATSRALRAGTLVRLEDMIVKDMLASDAPPDATRDSPQARAAMAGSMVRRGLGEGAPLLGADVMRPGDRGFLAAVLDPGMRAASIAVDQASGSGVLIWPGDHVDVILTQSLDDQSLPAGRRVLGETVLTDLRVVAVDRHLLQGAMGDTEGSAIQAGPRTITVEVTRAAAERLAVAERLGKLALSIRAADEAQIASSSPIGGKSATTWGSDVSPALGTSRSTGASTVNVFGGASDKKEYKF